MRCLKAWLHPGQLTEQDLVLLATNNNPDVTTACGGSHWCARSKLGISVVYFAVSGEAAFIRKPVTTRTSLHFQRHAHLSLFVLRKH